MSVLSAQSRKELEKACVRGRRASEAACRVAITSLELLADRRPAHLSEANRDVRRGLRAKRRQLGDQGNRIDLLVAECAYEQWHRLLFARFLAENGLLIHPEYRAPVSLAECDDLAVDLGEADGWAVAGRFAAQILPGIFRLDDPCVQLRLAPEGRIALEQIVADLPSEIFGARDALGWIYQYWQRDKKDEVNDSGRKIGGADVGPVTQLFTENYMVRYLLENSLGAWWARRHPDSPLLATWSYLRFDDEGKPAAGSFTHWPSITAELTVMDPCCGSGHFLVEAFNMLWRMRAEEEGLAPVDAQDAVLRDNLFGLELDSRCVQIAMFAVALNAWKAGGGWRELPVPNVACSGIPVKTPVDEWTALANGVPRLEHALARLHVLFREADTFGSLINPRRAVATNPPLGQKSFDEGEWEDVIPLLLQALKRESPDLAASVLGADAAGIARAASYLSRRYTLVATNVPYLGSQKMPESVTKFLSTNYPSSSRDLATVFIDRCSELVAKGSAAVVSPLGWLYLQHFADFRRRLLAESAWHTMALLGKGAFDAVSGHVVQSSLLVLSPGVALGSVAALDAMESAAAEGKAAALRENSVIVLQQRDLEDSPDTLLSLEAGSGSRLGNSVSSWQGLVTGDVARFIVRFWEVPASGSVWERFVTAPAATREYEGRTSFLRWEAGRGALKNFAGAHNFNPSAALGRPGVLVAQMGDLNATLYLGEMFNDKSVPLVPDDESSVAALWAYASSPEFRAAVRRINQGMSVGNGYFLKIPFDRQHWEAVAAQTYPGGLPAPGSDDPTQWLFSGRPEAATEAVQVAVARLLGYVWPEQPNSDDLEELADDDGIVCLPSVLGERTAADRLHEMLARAFGGTWSPARAASLVADSGSKKTDLDSWLRDDFFRAHCQVFKNRPLIWHVWDGRKDGFAALLNYHRLNRPTLERLTYTYLGDWIERHVAGARDDVLGADDRLAAARDLQRRLELILAGEPPYDIYIRWKSIAEQPIGWDPDLNDGVRLNVRPFVEAGVLRSKFNVKWEKDRGKNTDGSARANDRHFTTAQKHSARSEASA